MNNLHRNPVHLYRALLREASYLFNTTLQDFHTQHIRWSFRRQLSPSKLSRHGVPDLGVSSLPTQYETQQLRRGRQYLYVLQRANQGYKGALANVLRMAYARKGKRRRELLKDITTPDPVTSEPSSDPSTPPQEWQPPAKFSMLLKKQKGVHNYLDRGGTIKPMPVIPKKNRYGKPFPKSRARNMIRTWYAKHANLLLPPLSEKEWLEAYQSATDSKQSPKEATMTRRPAATAAVFAPFHAAGIREYAELQDFVVMSSQVGRPKISNTARGIIGNPHKMTPRFLRRMMLRTVVQNTPVVLADPESGKLAPRWDSTGTKHHKPRNTSETQQLLLFD